MLITHQYGCLFLSVIFSIVLWGAGSLQLFHYYDVRTLDTAQQVLRLQVGYVFFVKGIADPTLLNYLPKTFASGGILVAIVDAMVQIIFARRAWYLSKKNRVLAAILCLFIPGQFTATIIYTVRLFSFSQVMQVVEAVRVGFAMNCIMAFTDTMLALVLIYLLRKGRSGIKTTDSLINRLIIYTVGSGLAMALCMIAALIAAQAAPSSFIYLVIDEPLPRLYLNCLLTSLNSRESLRESLQRGAMEMALHLEDHSFSLPRRVLVQPDSFSKTTCPGAMECRVDIDVESGTDHRNVSNYSA